MPTKKNGKKATQKRRLPLFDEELMELRLDGFVVKRFDRRCKDQLALLFELQVEGWRDRIDDPLEGREKTGASSRLRQAVYRLNQHQHEKVKVHFFLDGSGHGIRWEITE